MINESAINDNDILKKIAPIPNERGVMVVEVSKVVRDLRMLWQTVKQAKFYRMLVNVNEWNEEEKDSETTGECAVQIYR